MILMPLKRKRFTIISDARMKLNARKAGQGALTEAMRVGKTLEAIGGLRRASASNESLIKHQTQAQRVILSKSVSDIITTKLMRRANIPLEKRKKILEASQRLADAEARVWTETIRGREEKFLEILEEVMGEQKGVSFFREYQKNWAHNLSRIDKALKQNPTP